MTEFSATDRFFMFFPSIPLVLAVMALLALAAFSGHLAHRWWLRRSASVEWDFDKEGYVLSVSSGLLALLLGFTFSMAIDRFDARRGMVVEEANGIYSTFLMAQTFGAADRDRISATLVRYVDHRLEAAKNSDQERAVELFREGRTIKVQLWSEALAATRNLRDDVASQFLQTATDALAVGAAREAARIGRIPPRIYIALWLFSAITAAVFGFAFQGRGKPVALTTIVVLQTLALAMILDLDRPTSGAIREPQWAMEDLKLRLAEAPPSAYQPAAEPAGAEPAVP